MDRPLLIAGIDEAGRGPLAGPVVAAAVILDPLKPIKGLADSKKLSSAQRERLYQKIMLSAYAVGVGRCGVAEIDELNILQATLRAMQRAVAALHCLPTRVLVDGNRCPELEMPSEAIIGGDDIEPSIMAASIIAKVTRDREMIGYENLYPGYGFAQHKGYGTKMHLSALQQLGITPCHRTSFAPVRNLQLTCVENL